MFYLFPGPHSGGGKISYALWFKTEHSWRNQILVHYGPVGSNRIPYKDRMFTLTLNEGRPAIHTSRNFKLVASDENINLATNEWQHLAISMPRKSCRLGEVEMFVNGQRVDTVVEGNNHRLFLVTAGRLSVGGFGRSLSRMEALLPEHEPFEGLIDDVWVWARDLRQGDIERIYV